MKYIPSIAFEEMSGSAKGVTAAKMKSRKYIRNRGYGGSVRTADQAKVKGVFKRLTTMWKSLTPAQILAWNKLALSQEGRSVLGSKAKISGANLFTRLNYWIVACGGQPSVTPPELVGVENPSSATIVCQGETFTFKLDQALADNGGIYLVIEATEGQSNCDPRPCQGFRHQARGRAHRRCHRHPCGLRGQVRRPQRCGAEDLLPLLLRQLQHRREVRHHAGRSQVGRCRGRWR